MTTAGVKSVDSMLNNVTAATATRASGQTAGASFQSVWDSRTGKNEQELSSDSTKKTNAHETENDDKLKAGEPDNADNVQDGGDNRVKESSDADEPVENNEEKDAMADAEEAMEVLMTAVSGLVDAITETFEISEEELNGLLEDMGLTTVDLLDAGKLGDVLIEAAGAESPSELLTDEALYQDFSTVMNELNNILASDSGIADMSIDELKAAVSVQTQEISASNPDMEITDERMTDVRTEENFTVKEDGGLGANVMLERADSSRELSEQAGRDLGERSSGKNSNEGAQGAGPFLQNLQNDNTDIVSADTLQSAGETVDTQDIMQQIMDYMKIQVKSDMSSLEMQLHPESLGTIRVQLSSDSGVVTANFVTQNEAVRTALESQMLQLKENLAEQGVKVEAIEVTVEPHQFEENLEQDQRGGQNAEDTSRRGSRVRRLRLDGVLSPDELEEMDSNDRIAAEMMEANGGTVDYMA